MEELRSLSDELEALMREGAVSDGLMKDAGQEDAKVTKTVKLACASYREILQRAHPVKKE